MAVGRCRKLNATQVKSRGLRTRIYLRHPITRFASMFAYFAPNDNYPIQPSRAAWQLEKYLSIEQFIDAVLDLGIENEHWLPQLAQHELPMDEVFTLERIHETWPAEFPLGHYNKGKIDKPDITYRLSDLETYYAEDLAAWSKANEQ